MQAPAVRIRRRCDTSTRFDYNRSHLTLSPALPLLLTRRRRQAGLRRRSGRSLACAAPGNFLKLRFSPGGYWTCVPQPLPEPLPLR